MTTTAVANGANDVERKAAEDANQIQDACNLVAIVGCWHRHLLALHRIGIGGDNLINHPTSLAFVSKLNSLCRVWRTSAMELENLVVTTTGPRKSRGRDTSLTAAHRPVWLQVHLNLFHPGGGKRIEVRAAVIERRRIFSWDDCVRCPSGR